jgi:hypothetical protein
MNKFNIYLDDVRTPKNNEWIIVRNYDEFVSTVSRIGFENIHIISLDHDLGDSAISEYINNVKPNYILNYDNVKEKTGLDCAKWLVEYFYYSTNKTIFPNVFTHSANPIGSANIIGYINNFYKNEKRPETCVRVNVEHKIQKP